MLRPAEFEHVFRQPVRSSDTCFRILARTNDTDSHRLGMAVSKKVCRGAVRRNRIKRVIRESFRTEMVGQPSTGQMTECTLDIVVLPTRQAASDSKLVLKQSLSMHWQKLMVKAADQNTGHGRH